MVRVYACVYVCVYVYVYVSVREDGHVNVLPSPDMICARVHVCAFAHYRRKA